MCGFDMRNSLVSQVNRPDRDEGADMGVAEVANAVRAGSVSATELVTDTLDSLHRWQPVTNAVSQLWPEEALAAARRLLTAGDLPLQGIPVLVKENMDVAGHPTTGCCDAFRDQVATEDCELVTQLKSAGAIIIGKANMHELAASGTNHISSCGPTRNPWNPARLTGGSSGGSAAAVATRSVLFSLGTDTAGSVRIPASFCGVAGLKSTQDRLSMHGVMPLAPSFDSPGPLAASVQTLAVVHGVLANEIPAIGLVHGPLAGLQLGTVSDGYYAESVHPDVRAALDEVTKVLAAADVTPVPVALPSMDGALSVWGDIAWPQFAAAYPDLDLQRVGHQIAEHHRYGQNLDAAKLDRARARAFVISHSLLSALRKVNVLLVACTPYTAPRFDDQDIDVGGGRTMNVFRGGPVWFTCPIDIAGLPALALPAGFTADGLPIGVQLVGRPGEEWTLLRMGAAFQARTNYHRAAPAFPERAYPDQP